MVYWPSSHWHVVASDGEPSAVVQISAYFGARLSHLISQHVQRLLRMELGRGDILDTYPRCETATGLPQALAEAQERLGRIWQDGMLDGELQRFWLAHLTADGFTAVPPAQTDAPLDRDTPIAVRADEMLAWRQDRAGQLVMAANGLTRTVDDAAALREMLAYLSSGEFATVAELVGRYAQGQNQAAGIENVLDWLYRCRALVAG